MRAHQVPILGQKSQLAQGVIAAYDFALGIGPNVPDVSGNGNNGVWQGTLGSQWGPGKIGGGGVFNGSDNTVNTSQAPTIGTGDFSMAIWVKSTTTATAKILFIIGDQSTTKGSAYFYIQDSGHLVFGTWTSSSPPSPAVSPSLVFDGNWHLLTGVKSGNFLTLYLDGVGQGQGTVTGINLIHASPWIQIGGFSTGKVTASLDEAIIWGRALSPNDISALYALGQGKAYPFT